MQEDARGEYGEIVLERIIERGLSVAVFFNSKKWINLEMEELLKSQDILVFDVSEHDIEEIMTRILIMATASIRNNYSRKGLNRYAEVAERQKSDLDKLIDYIYKV